MFPDARKVDTGNIGTGEKESVGMAAEPAVESLELEPVFVGESKSGLLKMLTALCFEEVASRKYVSYPCRMCRIAHPVELDLP